MFSKKPCPKNRVMSLRFLTPILPYVSRYAGQSVVCHLHTITHTKENETFYLALLFDTYSHYTAGKIYKTKEPGTFKPDIQDLIHNFIPGLKSTTLITDSKEFSNLILAQDFKDSLYCRCFLSNKYMSSTHVGKLIPQFQKDIFLPYFSKSSKQSISQLQRALNKAIKQHNSSSLHLYSNTKSRTPLELIKHIAPDALSQEDCYTQIDRDSKKFLEFDTHTNNAQSTTQPSLYEPADGKTLFFLGQEKNFISDYLGFHKHTPYGFSVYTGLHEGSSFFGDEWSVFGCQNLPIFSNAYPDAALSIAIYLVDTNEVPERIMNGEFDIYLDKFIEILSQKKCPLFLRIGYEIEAGHLPIHPDIYKKTYKYIHKKFQSKLKGKIAYVWHLAGYKTDNDIDIMDWYPGDNYVDWIGFNVFDWPYHTFNNPYILNILDQAQKRKKATMICAASPVYGIEHQGSKAWNYWFADVFSFINRHNIKAFTWCQYNFLQFESLQYRKWGDARIYKNPKVMKLWEDALRCERFQMG